MAEATTPDYRNSHFEKSHLPVHAGEPTFDVIRTWHNILKANATKVHTSLFGGNHGSYSYTDFFLMTFAKHYVVAPTSYNWWGAWLSKNINNAQVLRPNDNFFSDYFINNKDFWPESWQIITKS